MIHDNSNYQFNFLNLNLGHKTSVCEDQHVGTVALNSNFHSNGKNVNEFYLQRLSVNNKKNYTYQKRHNVNYNNFSRHTANKVMVVVLESPHIFEFINNINSPAWGTTGNKFNFQFIPLLNRYINLFQPFFNSTFDVYLVNAIRYQTSLGLSPIIKSLRDTIFIHMWKNGFDKDFQDRLAILKPDLIINAVTSRLKPIVQAAINSFINNNLASIFQASSHPSVWGKIRFYFNIL